MPVDYKGEIVNLQSDIWITPTQTKCLQTWYTKNTITIIENDWETPFPYLWTVPKLHHSYDWNLFYPAPINALGSRLWFVLAPFLHSPYQPPKFTLFALHMVFLWCCLNLTLLSVFHGRVAHLLRLWTPDLTTNETAKNHLGKYGLISYVVRVFL